METEQAIAYRNQVKGDIKGLSYSDAKWWINELKKEDPAYEIARFAVSQYRNSLKEERRFSEAISCQQVKKSPLLEISEDRIDLSDEQKIMVWATQKQAEFERLQEDPLLGKRQTASFVASVANELLKDPRKINIAARAWKTKLAVPESDFNSLYNFTKKELAKKLGKKAELLPETIMGELVRAYAYGNDVADISQAALKAYFHDRGRINNAETLYSFGLAVFDLIDDTLAFEKGLLIANFEDEAVLQRSSDIYTDFIIGRNSLDDNDLLRKIRHFSTITFDSLKLTSLDSDAIMKRNTEFDKNPKLREKLDKYLQHVAKKLSEEETARRLQLINATQETLKPVIITRENISRLMQKWPTNIIFDDTDPLSQKYKQTGESKVSSLMYRDMATKRMVEEEGMTSFNYLSITLPEGVVIEVCIGGDIDQEKRAALVRKIAREGAIFYESKKEEDFFSGAIITGEKGRLGHNPYHFWLRHTISPEKQQHPLSGLEVVGLPASKIEKGETLAEAINRLHQDLISNQTRFINRRGFKVSIPSLDLRRLGYQEIIFRSTDNHRILVETIANNIVYPIKLDPNFNWDLEGKKPLSPVFNETFSYLVYSLLKPIVCEARESLEGPEFGTSNLEVISRIGYFRELTKPGYHYSRMAIENCFREQGKDLITEQIRLQSRPGRETDNPFTYVKEIREKAENLPPQEFRIAVIPGFG